MEISSESSMSQTGRHIHTGDFAKAFRFPRFNHPPAEIIDVNEVVDKQLSVGDRIADKVASTVGSWPFIITQSFILLCWIILNVTAVVRQWDPYPFILLNLALSFQAAYAAPFVMMSQNRQASKDRLTAENDYTTDSKSEEEIRHILEHLDHQDSLILKINQLMERQHIEMLRHLQALDPEKRNQLLDNGLFTELEPSEPENNAGGNS